jgi:hypothetical protein
VRRLYDIANILSSLQLIEKVIYIANAMAIHFVVVPFRNCMPEDCAPVMAKVLTPPTCIYRRT